MCAWLVKRFHAVITTCNVSVVKQFMYVHVSYSKYCLLCAYVCIQEGVREGQVSGQSLQESLDAIEVSKLRVFALNPDTFSCMRTLYRSRLINHRYQIL